MRKLFYNHVFTRVAWVAFWYYRVTLFLTRPRRMHAQDKTTITTLPEIPRYNYARDKPLDYMRHPMNVGMRILLEEAPGDCDDYASWRAWYALRQGRMRDAGIYICILRMSGRSGHVVVLFEQDDGTWEYCDYGLRTRVWFPEDHDAGAFDPIEVGTRITRALYSKSLHGMAFAPVYLNATTGLRFGAVEAYAP